MDFNNFRVDEKKENDGVWIPCGLQTRIKVARLGSRRFRDKYQELSRPYAALMRIGRMEERDQEEILAQCVAEAILLDWEGFTEDGVDIPYSKENALRICKEQREFLLFVVQQAESADNFRPDREQTRKNFETVSTGS